METQQSALSVYQQELKKHTGLLALLRKRRNRLGWTRLAVVLLTGFAAYHLFGVSVAAGCGALAAGIAAFLWLVARDVDNNSRMANTETLVRINEEALLVLQDQYHHRYDGSGFAPALHDYANDLDLFGKASLYQYLNRAGTEQGRSRLAANLLQPLPAGAVAERQEAIRELAPLVAWRQQLEAYAAQVPVTRRTQERAEYWLGQEEEHFTARAWQYGLPLYAAFTITTALAALLGWLPGGLFSLLLIVYLLFSGSLSRHAMKAYTHLDGIVQEVAVLYRLLQWIEGKAFGAPLLQRMQASVAVDGRPGFEQLEGLKKILGRFELRLNVIVFIVLNSFLLWDVWQMRALNRWRRQNRSKLTLWFELIAEAEVLNSLATLHFNRPQWAFPVFVERHLVFAAKAIGHPLLPEGQRVTSDFSLQGEGKVALITGSNMAGKSTFLRSLGVNSILAHMGAPVCASALECSPVRLMSSMRIADNLAENTSTFYAELKKLKTIIEAVGRRAPLLILLDEILRGTNSLDRHIGTKALVRQLIRDRAVAVLATHDVEVARLEEAYPEALENYHFDVQVEGEELYFDYLLKAGVCKSLNASILMKKIGIEL